MLVIRIEDEFGGSIDNAQSQADRLAVAMAVSLQRLPDNEEIEIFASYLHLVAEKLAKQASR